MGKPDAVEAVKQLMGAFRQELSPETVVIYGEKLEDIPIEWLAPAIDHLIEHRTFFPAIAEIRHAVAKLAGLLPPGPAEELELVRHADVREPIYRRDGSLAYTERYWRWPDSANPVAVEAARRVLQRIGEPCEEDGSPRFGWDTDFKKTYEAEAEEITRRVLADLPKALLAVAQRKLLVGR